MSIPEVIALDDVLQMIFSQLRGVWRYRWHFLGVAWFVALTGWGVVYTMPNLYQTSGKVAIIDPQKELAVYIKSVPGVDITSAARSVLDQLVSRDNIIKIISQLDIAEKFTDEKQLEQAALNIRQTISILPQKGNTYSFIMKHNDPKLAYAVLQGLMNILMQGRTGNLPTAAPQKAANILNDQINDFQKQLATAENELRAFKKEHIDILGENDGDYYATLKSMHNQLENESNRLKELLKKREEVIRQLGDRGGVEIPVENEPDGDQRILEAKARLAEMQGKFYMKGNVKRYLYPDDHPEVIAMRRTIEAMEEQKKKGLPQSGRELRKLEEMGRDKEDPYITKLKMNLSDLDVEFASLTSRIEDIKKRIAIMKELEPKLPTVMTELEHHKKKVFILKDKLSNMMNTQGEADFTGNLVANLSKLVRFEITEKPVMPVAPIGPDRKLFYSLTLAGGLAAGLAYALILAYMRPVFDSATHLKQVLGLPVLGTVSMVVEPGFILGILPRSSFHWLLALLLLSFGVLMAYAT
ncbi:MAG: hypothetical protein HQL55_05560 [Magnetococcales bacterium]|nr:hypothetical protein [Magnetococcales bacterium]